MKMWLNIKKNINFNSYAIKTHFYESNCYVKFNSNTNFISENISGMKNKIITYLRIKKNNLNIFLKYH